VTFVSDQSKTGVPGETIKAWRKAERARLVEARSAVADENRAVWNARMTEYLVAAFPIPADSVIAFCWPYAGEFDARHAVRQWREQGAVAVLPEVTDTKAPLRFRQWWPGVTMRAGVYDIPVPVGTEILTPDIVLVPMVGFDGCGYRLGYGGGYFDRTLALCERRVIAIGVSYEVLRLETIHPQTHDIPMDFVVTEAGVYAAGGNTLEQIDFNDSARRLARLLLARRLPHAAYPESGYSSPTCYASEFPGYWGEDDFRKPDR
jgi:5,10-methenyltetrahydrofolate synthetase